VNTTDMKKKVLTDEMIAAIDIELAKFPADRKRSASLSALRIVQELGEGWVSESQMDAIADCLSLPPIAIYEVASFYTMCQRSPVGRYNICVCTNLSCSLRHSQEMVDHLQKRLNIGFGETTPDGQFSLEEVECLGACIAAPVMQIGKKYHERLTPEKIDRILDELGSETNGQ
jgi:NADH-quinone oxidoreductase subunit E